MSSGTPARGLHGERDVYTVSHAVPQSAGHLTSPRTCWTGVQHPNRHACSVEMGGQTPHPPQILGSTRQGCRDFRQPLP